MVTVPRASVADASVPSLEALLGAVDNARDELANLLAALVRFPTVNYGDGHPGQDGIPNGNETPCATYLRDLLAADGIAAAVHESAPSRGNLIARLPGAGRSATAPLDPQVGASLLFMSHLDVVPVEGAAGWAHPPFAGAIVDDVVYGRGSQDAKSMAACAAIVMQVLRRQGVTLRGDLAMLAAADEESGGRFGAGWVASHPELGSQVSAAVALNEGGGGAIRAPGGLAYGFATGEKGRLEVRVHVQGKPGHASAPWRAENALERAGIVLERLRAYQPQLDTSHPLFRAVPPLFGIQEPITPDTLPGVIERLQVQHDTVAGSLRAASRLTLVPTMLHAGVKSNSIPAACTVVCDSRTLPHQDAAYVHGQLSRLLEDLPWATVEVHTTAVSNASSYDEPFRHTCLAALRLALGREDVQLAPALCAGFTDSRFFRPLGVRVYDFMPLHPEAAAGDVGVHGTNERIEVAGLVTRARFLMAAACLTLGIA